MPKLRQSRNSDLAQLNRWVHGLLQWGCLDAPQAVGVFSSQNEKVTVGTDLWDAYVGNGDYEIVDFGDGTFTFKKKDYSGAQPPPPPKEEVRQCGDYLHEIEKYVGFTEAYDFCKICDAKKIDGKWVRN